MDRGQGSASAECEDAREERGKEADRFDSHTSAGQAVCPWVGPWVGTPRFAALRAWNRFGRLGHQGWSSV